MWYLIGKILLCLIAAFLLGMLFGWLLWGRNRDRRDVKTDLEKQINQRDQNIRKLRASLEACHSELADVKKTTDSPESGEISDPVKTVAKSPTGSRQEQFEKEQEHASDPTGGEEKIILYAPEPESVPSEETAAKIGPTMLADFEAEVEDEAADIFSEIPEAINDEFDDLKLIKGIGPYLEERLHEFGIVSFRQIMGLTPEVMEKVGETFGAFSGRISRENWVEQATRFFNDKYGDSVD